MNIFFCFNTHCSVWVIRSTWYFGSMQKPHKDFYTALYKYLCYPVCFFYSIRINCMKRYSDIKTLFCKTFHLLNGVK